MRTHIRGRVVSRLPWSWRCRYGVDPSRSPCARPGARSRPAGRLPLPRSTALLRQSADRRRRRRQGGPGAHEARQREDDTRNLWPPLAGLRRQHEVRGCCGVCCSCRRPADGEGRYSMNEQVRSLLVTTTRSRAGTPSPAGARASRSRRRCAAGRSRRRRTRSGWWLHPRPACRRSRTSSPDEGTPHAPKRSGGANRYRGRVRRVVVVPGLGGHRDQVIG